MFTAKDTVLMTTPPPASVNGKTTARYAALSIVAIFAVSSALQSCRKDDHPVASSSSGFNPKAMILGFLQDVQDRRAAGYKSNEVFTTDSAIWYVEAGLNFTLGN
jgi:hypothetical protein